MRRNFKIICMLVIIILINSKSFAEPTKFKVNEKINETNVFEKFEEKVSYFINSDVDVKEFHQVWNKLDKSINISESKDILENKFKIEIINILDKDSIICEMDILEEQYYSFVSEETDIYVYEWNGKDRIFSLDLDDDEEDLYFI